MSTGPATLKRSIGIEPAPGSVLGSATAAAAPQEAEAKPAGPQHEEPAATDVERAAQEAAEAAAAAVDADEEELPSPQDPRALCEAKALAARQLLRQRKTKEAVAMYDEALATEPDVGDRYHLRGAALMDLGREKEAIQDFTVALDLPNLSGHARYQSLMFRSKCKLEIGDMKGADEDLKAAEDAAQDETHKAEAKEHRRGLVMLRVKRRQQEDARKAARPPRPVVHRYGSATIQELEPEEGSLEHEEAVAHERASAWQEAAHKLAAEARGKAARISQDFEAQQERVREENQARRDRNAVRAARRRSAAADAAAAVRETHAREAAERVAQRRQEEEQRRNPQRLVMVERTEIPIRIVNSAAGKAGGAAGKADSAAGKVDGSSSSSKGASAASSAASAGKKKGQQGGKGSKVGAKAAERATAVGAVAAAAAAHPEAKQGGSAAEEPAEAPALPKAEDPQAVAAAAPEAATAAAGKQDGLGKQDDGWQAAEQQEEHEQERVANGTEDRSAAASREQQDAKVPALLSDSELDALKARGDRLQAQALQGSEEADTLYSRYLRQRPADQRVWNNRAENCIKGTRWQDALDCCNSALAVASPSHAAPRHKMLARRGRAYHGMGRLQEALRDFEAADTAAEVEGVESARQSIAKHMTRVLKAMEAQGIEPAPTGPSALGLQASAAAAQLHLPVIPVVPPPVPLVVPPERVLEEDAGQGSAQGSPEGSQDGDGGSRSTGAAEADEQPPTPPLAAAVTGAASPPSPGGSPPPAAGAQAAASAEEVAAHARQASKEARQKGNASYNRRQWEQAARHYERAAGLDPSCKLAHSNLAAALLQLKRWGEAEAAADKALAIDSSYDKARYRRAQAYRGQGRLEWALMDLKNVVEMVPHDRAILGELRAVEEEFNAEQEALGLPTTHNNPLFSPVKSGGR